GLQIRRRRAGDHLDPPFPVPHGLPLLLRPTPTRAASPPRTDSTAEPTGRVPTEELTRRRRKRPSPAARWRSARRPWAAWNSRGTAGAAGWTGWGCPLPRPARRP